MERSAERQQFLADILSTALEGGVNYWAQVDEIRRGGDYPDGDWHYESCRLFESGDGDTTCHLTRQECQGHTVTVETVAKGVGIILRMSPQSRHYWSLQFATSERDAGDVDADMADDIVQCGIFGQAIYG